jgi:hypothetical protein
MHCQQGGEVWACFCLLNAFRRFLSGFEPFWALAIPRWSSAWPVTLIGLTVRIWAIWCTGLPVRWTGLTGQSKAGAAALFCEEACMHSSRGSCIGLEGSLHVCRGSSLWFLLFAYACFFVSVVSSHCPYLRGPRLYPSIDLPLLPLFRLSVACLSFL